MTQQGDVRLFQTDDGGDIFVIGGVVDMDGGLETAAYLSLFGGNEDDPGGAAESRSWWANLNENDSVRQYRSETGNLLQALELSPANLRRIEDAATRDLDWMLTEGIASSIEVVASIPGLNRVQLTVTILAIGGTSEFVFAENWKASA